MPVSDQGISFDRYMLIPRVLIFITRGTSVLLIKGASSKRLWAGKYNGVGGHVENGEDILGAAQRELLEETGLKAYLRLVGTVTVDTGKNPGIELFVYTGDCPEGDPIPSAEGSLEWIPFDDIPKLPAVEDLPILWNRIVKIKDGAPTFSARSFYDEEGNLKIEFTE